MSALRRSALLAVFAAGFFAPPPRGFFRVRSGSSWTYPAIGPDEARRHPKRPRRRRQWAKRHRAKLLAWKGGPR